MNIELKQLKLENFMGIKDIEVKLNHNTSICADNALGKTTIFSSFTWLLFGKNSSDSKDFNIKTLDASGQAIPQIDHSVEGILLIDGSQVTLRRLYRERWTRRRGEEESALTGHETLFYWNEVPLLAGEYKTKIEELIDEGLFKLLTSTVAFNSMKWQDRRQVLVQIAGGIGNADIMKSMKKDQVKDITDILNSGKPMEEYRKEIVMRKKKLDNDLKLIPSRIDEVQRSMPEPQDFDKIQQEIDARLASIEEIETAINDQVAAYQEQGNKIQQVQSQVFDLKKKQQALEFEITSKAQQAGSDAEMQRNKLSNQLAQANQKFKDEQNNIVQFTEAKERTERAVFQLRNDWSELSAKICIIDKDFTCPTCKRSLDPTDVEAKTKEIQDNFEKDKAERLREIKDMGSHRSTTLARINADIKASEGVIAQLTVDIARLQTELAVINLPVSSQGISPDDHPGLAEIKKEIATLELQVLESPKLDIEGLKQQRVAVQSELETLKITFGTKDSIARAEKRTQELLDEEKSLAQQISTLEKSEFAMDAYTRSKMDLVEIRVNEKFKLVRFKMFNVLLNLGIEECCETTLGGIPYADVNSAGKIQAGVDIINTLTEHYGIMAPIFADNAETVNEMPETKSQLIKLIVTKDSQLIIK